MHIGSGIDWSARSWEEVCQRHRWQIPERFNIGVAACDRHADGSGRLALISEDAEGRALRTSFDDLKEHSARLMTVFTDLGVEPGDRVAVFLPQRLETALAHLAAFKLGAITVPLSPLFRAEALAYRIGHSEPKVVVTDVEHHPHLAAALRELGGQPPEVLVCDESWGSGSFWKLLESAAVRRHPRPALDTSRDDPAMLIYTSGTSGMPKGALHAHRFLPGRLSGFELVHRLEQRPSRDRPFWTPADWAWVGGLVDCVLTPWVFGCPVLAHRRRGFDPQDTFRLLSRHRVRSLFLAPTAVVRLQSEQDVRARFGVDVETVHTAGEPLSPEAYAWAARELGSVFELYGMTEMGATVGNAPFFPVRPGSMGKPYPGHHVSLLDEQGNPVKDGEVGEIAVREGDPGMFLGYYRDPEATAARFRNGHLMTGDLARKGADGYFHYQGRTDDVFNTSGYRVGPTEIEASLEAHPAVEKAAVVGEPDPERGAVVKAFVVLRAGSSPSDTLALEIQNHVRDRLALHERPRRIVFARELPMTVSGKIRRNELRAPDADRRFGL